MAILSQAEKALADLRDRVLAGYPLIFLTTFEEDRWEAQLSSLALDIRGGLVTWSDTEGLKPPLTQASRTEAQGPIAVLNQLAAYPPEHIFLFKDFHPHLKDPVVIRKLRDLAAQLRVERKTLMMMSPDTTIPLELERDVVRIDLPLPEIDDLEEIYSSVLAEHHQRHGRKLQPTPDEREKMLKTLIGLTQRQALAALSRALLGRTTIDDSVYAALVAEKKALLRGSELLEFYELSDGIRDIGGLDGLKEWLVSRSSAYSEKARKAGLPMPKGVLLLGVQGCGKSLTARAAARLLSFPLIRMDIASVLSSDRGSSERNLREALRTVESVAPAVLWLDEIEKAFAGLGNENAAAQDGTLNRLFGMFLTWLQDHGRAIFVIATANSVNQLPPEMLRRGRFDELFFVNLPNFHERKEIFAIHLAKRRLDPRTFDLESLARKTEGYSGAEIEQVVVSAMYDAYTHGRTTTQHDLSEAVEQTVPLSVTMEEKIFELREWARTRCRPATPDSRVMQMLEEEARQMKG